MVLRGSNRRGPLPLSLLRGHWLEAGLPAAVIDDQSLATLRCRIVAGSAKNVLATPGHGERLSA